MNNGIIVKRHQDGIIIEDILHCADHKEELEIISEYFFPEYWENFIATPSEGKIAPTSFFIRHGGYAPLPCAAGFTLFTHCSDAKFAAGYLKFMVLCELIASVLVDLSEYAEFSNGNNFSFDIDYFLDKYSPDDSDKKEICERIEHILRLCNLVFLSPDEDDAKKHLFFVADKFNEYFSEVLGWDFEFRVYDGAEKAKSEILSFLTGEEKVQVEILLSKSDWSDDEKKRLSEILESIVG